MEFQRFESYWQKGAEWLAAFGGSSLVAVLVFAVNLDHGWQLALLACAKQALWTAVMAGVLTRFCRFLCTQQGFVLPPMVLATVLPSAVAITGVSLLHHLEGTPAPFASIMVTVLLAPPGFWFVANTSRRALLNATPTQS